MRDWNWRIGIGLAAFVFGGWIGICCGGIGVGFFSDQEQPVAAPVEAGAASPPPAVEVLPTFKITTDELIKQFVAEVPLAVSDEGRNNPGLNRIGLRAPNGTEPIVIWDHKGNVSGVVCDLDTALRSDAKNVAVLFEILLDEALARSAIRLVDFTAGCRDGDHLSIEHYKSGVSIYRMSPTKLQVTIKAVPR